MRLATWTENTPAATTFPVVRWVAARNVALQQLAGYGRGCFGGEERCQGARGHDTPAEQSSAQPFAAA